jgi:creatinine amidohydrolase
MSDTARPLRIKDLTPEAVRHALVRDPRLLVPVGTCEDHGPHLPVGADTFVVERLADDLSAEFGILVAPTVEFGVNDRRLTRSGGASVRRKTLRRWLNDLLADWEDAGVVEFLVLTMNGYAPHQEALGTAVPTRARLRVIDLLGFDFGGLAEFPDDPVHGGEVDTSLVLYVRPDLVRMDLAYDCILPDTDLRRYRRGTALRLPAGSQGSVGHARAASAEKGARFYASILSRLRARVFTPPPTNPPPGSG